MKSILDKVQSPLFDGLSPEDRRAIMGCVGYHIHSYKKGQTVVFEDDHVRHIGILLSGCVDMIKEDIWGNKTLLLRIRKDGLFGESFACCEDNTSIVSFVVSQDAQIIFMPFDRVMHSCSMSCSFHHQLLENMVKIIAGKNRDLMRKIEVVSKKTLREKILAYLSLQAQAQDSQVFEIPLGRVEWAEYLCANRSALTRELAKMQEEGLIRYQQNFFEIL